MDLTQIPAWISILATLLVGYLAYLGGQRTQKAQHKRDELTRYDHIKREVYGDFIKYAWEVATSDTDEERRVACDSFTGASKTIELIGPRSVKSDVEVMVAVVRTYMSGKRTSTKIGQLDGYLDAQMAITACISSFRSDLRMEQWSDEDVINKFRDALSPVVSQQLQEAKSKVVSG